MSIKANNGRKDKRKGTHRHYTQGDTGYVPKSAGINPYSKQGRAVFYRR